MDSKTLNLFKFLSGKEDRHLSKKTLDILICKYSFNPDNKELIDYLKSLGGRDDFFKDVKKWMDEMFKDLKEFTSDKYPLSTFYGTSKDNIILEEDLKNDMNYIHHGKVYLVFLSKYKGYASVFLSKYNGYVSDYKYIISIFQEYLRNYLHLKGSRTDPYGHFDESNLVNTLQFK